jgi:hypothetical protein
MYADKTFVSISAEYEEQAKIVTCISLSKKVSDTLLFRNILKIII